MQLSKWVEPHGRQTALAKALRCQPQLVSQWANGIRDIPEDRCPAIEAATSGKVTCEEMGTDVVWKRMPDKTWNWHPKGRPMNDVARTGAIREAKREAERLAAEKKAEA